MAKKLWVGILAGAAIGGAITLLDRETREKTVQKASNLKTDVQYLYYNRGEVKEKAQGNMSKIQGLIENVMENKDFYLEKIAELRESTPKLTQQLLQTKEAFTKADDSTESVEPVAPVEPISEEQTTKPEDVIHL